MIMKNVYTQQDLEQQIIRSWLDTPEGQKHLSSLAKKLVRPCPKCDNLFAGTNDYLCRDCRFG